MKSDNKNLRVCLFWHNLNSANYGVGALAIAHLSMLVNAAKENNIKLHFETWGTRSSVELIIQEDLEKRLGVQVTHHNYGLRTILKDLLFLRWGKINPYKGKMYDLVFDIGEGDSFADIYGIKRFLIFSANKYFAIKSQVPLIIAPQTIGPFNNYISSIIATYLLRRSQAVYTRDHKSSDYLKKMKVGHHEVSDVAFLLPFDQKNKIDNSVGINVSGLLWHGGYTKKNQFNLSVNYQKLIVDLINGFIEREQKIYLVAHVISDTDGVEDDYRTAEKIKAEYFLENDLVMVAPKFTSPIEAKSFISSMKFFLGSRMHATIGAISAGVPTIPLAYSRKFSGVFGTISYPHTYDLYGSTIESEILNNIFLKFDEDILQIAQDAEQAGCKAKQQLEEYEKFLLEKLK